MVQHTKCDNEQLANCLIVTNEAGDYFSGTGCKETTEDGDDGGSVDGMSPVSLSSLWSNVF